MRSFWKLPLFLATLLLIAPVYAMEESAGSEAVSPYVDLTPDLVINYGGVGRLRYLKAGISLRVDNPIGTTAVRQHMPFIRHTLVMMLSSASEEDVLSMEGREMLRTNALEAVRAVLMAEEGEQYVTDLLFSSFILQQ